MRAVPTPIAETLPNPGLPYDLPQGETILWQGQPRWETLAVQVFHVRKVLVWFGFLIIWGFAARLSEGQSLANALMKPGMLLAPMALAATLLLLGLAYANARSTTYTITSKRVTLRVGMALTMTINVPFSVIEAANLHSNGDGTGNLALALAPQSRIAWLILWPHVRPWRMARAEPMLRAVPEGEKVAAILGRAVAQASASDASLAVQTQRGAVRPVAAYPAGGAHA